MSYCLSVYVAGFVRVRGTVTVDARSAQKFKASFCSVRTKCFISLYHSTQALDYFLFCVHQLTKFFWQLYKLCAAADVWHYVRQFYQRYGIISTSQRESLSSGVAAAECCQSGSRHGRGTEYGSASRCLFMQMSGTTFLLFCMRTHPCVATGWRTVWPAVSLPVQLRLGIDAFVARRWPGAFRTLKSQQ